MYGWTENLQSNRLAVELWYDVYYSAIQLDSWQERARAREIEDAN